MRRQMACSFLARGVATLALLAPGGVLVRGQDFIRGDANGDGRVTTADVQAIDTYLFRTGKGLSCMDAADADDDEKVTISDAVNIFHYLVLGETPPAAPYPGAGPDTTPGEEGPPLGCAQSGAGSRLPDPIAAFRVVDSSAEGGSNRHVAVRLAVSNSTRIAGYQADIGAGALFSDKDLDENDWNDGILDLTQTLQGGLLLARSHAATSSLQAEYISSIFGDVAIPPRAEQSVLEMNLCLRPGTPAGQYPLTLRSAELVDFETGRGIDPVLLSGHVTVLEDVLDADCVIPPSYPWDQRFTHVTFRLEEATGAPGTEVEVPFVISATDHASANGVNLSIDFEEAALELLEVRPILQRPDGAPWWHQSYFLDNENSTPGNAGCDEGYLAGSFWYSSNDEPDIRLPVNQELQLLSLRFRIREGAAVGSTPLHFVERVPRQSEENQCESFGTSLIAGGINLTPGLVDSFVLVGGAVHIIGEVTTFLRGDTNDDRAIDLSDAVYELSYLFSGGPTPACMDAADANDDGTINISDPVSILASLFRGVGALPPPSGAPGADPTPGDKLGCGPDRR